MKNSVEIFNALNGKKISRSTLSELSTQAFNEQQFEVSRRLNKLLEKHPNAKSFELEIDTPAKFDDTAHGGKLAAPRHKGIGKEALTECGRLKPGYKFDKGGKIVKIEKKKKFKDQKKTRKTTNKTKNTPKKDVNPNKNKDSKSPERPKTKSKFQKEASLDIFTNKDKTTKVQIFRFKKEKTNRKFYAPEVSVLKGDGERINTAMFSRKSQAISLAREYLKNVEKIVKKEVSNKENKVIKSPAELKTRKDFELWLKANGFHIVKKHTLESIFKGEKNTQYQLNFKDVGGLVVDVFGRNVKDGYEAAFKIKGLGFDELDGLYPYDNASAFYEKIVFDNQLEKLTNLSINEADKLRKKYSKTLYQIKDKKQLALFGPKGKKRKSKTNPNIQKLGTVLIDVSTPTPAVSVSEGAVTAVPLEVVPQQNTNVLEKQPIVVPKVEKAFVNETKKPKSKLMQMSFDTIEMDEGWEDFMQEPAANMKLAIWGKPKNGKTSGALKLANYLTKKGSVFYNFVDQGFNKSTQDLWRNSGLANKSNAEPSDIDNLNDLESALKKGNYRFVFIDMINDYINKEKITPQEFKDRFIKGFPNTSFVLVFEVTKGGDFKGDQAWTHVVDAIVTVDSFLMENRGRYGMGHHVIWEEGFKKFNPKKYDEIMGLDTVELPGTMIV